MVYGHFVQRKQKIIKKNEGVRETSLQWCQHKESDKKKEKSREGIPRLFWETMYIILHFK